MSKEVFVWKCLSGCDFFIEIPGYPVRLDEAEIQEYREKLREHLKIPNHRTFCSLVREKSVPSDSIS